MIVTQAADDPEWMVISIVTAEVASADTTLSY
jgi:hypothetical protein